MKFHTDWVTGRCDQWAIHLAHLKGKSCKGIEIGCYEGRSTVWFLENVLTNPSSRIECVDPWSMEPKTFTTFTENIIESGAFHRVDVHKLQSHRANFQATSYEFAYVDGSHTGFDMMGDALKCWSALRTGGIMILDDRLWPYKGTTPLIEPMEQLLWLMGGRCEVLHKDYQMILKKR